MEEPRPVDSSAETTGKVNPRVGRPRVPFPVDRARRPQEGSQLLQLQEVCERLGVNNQRVYVLVEAGQLHPLFLPGGKRRYYAEWEVEALRASGGVIYRYADSAA
jgi:hypothetical protein